MGKCSVILLIGFYFTYLGRSVCNNEDSKVKTIKFSFFFFFFKNLNIFQKICSSQVPVKLNHLSEDLLIFILVPSIQLQVNFVQNHSNQKCSVKQVYLEILQNSQESTCARVSFLIKLHALGIGEKREPGLGVSL